MIAEIYLVGTPPGGGVSLQWGRDLAIAEMLLSQDRLTCLAALQWGRDLAIAEMRIQRTLAELLDRLQWGRDLAIAEIFAPKSRLAKQESGFNGAAIWRSRK